MDIMKTADGNGRRGAGRGKPHRLGCGRIGLPRWKAAIDARVDFIATDQFEGLAELKRGARR